MNASMWRCNEYVNKVMSLVVTTATIHSPILHLVL